MAWNGRAVPARRAIPPPAVPPGRSHMTRRANWSASSLVSAAVLWLAAAGGVRAQAVGPTPAAPPDAPAALAVRDGRVTLSYAGTVILEGTIGGEGASAELRTLVDSAGGRVTQVVKWTARGRGRLVLAATLRASDEAFACEVEPREDGLVLVRNSVGPSVSRLNRAVYDRHGDWVLSVDQPADVVVAPLEPASEELRPDAAAGPAGPGPRTARFSLRASGGEIALRFRPRFYQRHRGLPAFEPWTYHAWRGSVAGWSSWFAFFDRVTEADVRRTADVLAEVLLPYGYRYLQIDDGYQRAPVGPPANWLEWNAKFPSGLEGVSRAIAARGLVPGLWTNVAFHDRAWALAHPQDFLLSPDGGPAFGNWIGYVMDGGSAGALTDLVRPVYEALARTGWRYVKVDALRHLRYEGYNSHAEVFRRRGQDRVAVYRGVVRAIRDALGDRTFVLASWGPRPELAGLVDACRMGDDGFGYGTFAQFNSFNNVVWRNDPDHIELARDDAYRATSLTSLTGSLLMVTDPPEVYRGERVEAARRAAPVLFTVPAQVYDVDPSRSSRIRGVDAELSGDGPRPFEADQRLVQPLYLLEMNRPFERWAVLARTGGEPGSIPFAELGLEDGPERLVFEFWTKRYLGSFAGAFEPGPVDPRFGIQVFCIRERQPHPQLLTTDRHVSCGGVDLEDVAWRGDTLSGRSVLVAGDPYALYLAEPPGWRFAGAEAEGATVVSAERDGAVRVVRLRAAAGTPVSWHVRYEHRS